MKLIESTSHLGCEIQLFELTPEELQYFNDRDNAARRWAIVKGAVKRFIKRLRS